MRLGIFPIVIGTLTAIGCSSGDFPTASTSGTVMCEGAPVPHAMVFFEPMEKEGAGLVGKQGTATADENGNFVISTYGENDGAVVGKHRVRVAAPNREMHPEVKCPCELNPEKDVMQVEVTKGGHNEFQIVLNKKSANQQPSLDEMEAIRDAQQEARERQARRR